MKQPRLSYLSPTIEAFLQRSLSPLDYKSLQVQIESEAVLALPARLERRSVARQRKYLKQQQTERRRARARSAAFTRKIVAEVKRRQT
mgnify:CR=1 FL=1